LSSLPADASVVNLKGVSSDGGAVMVRGGSTPSVRGVQRAVIPFQSGYPDPLSSPRHSPVGLGSKRHREPDWLRDESTHGLNTCPASASFGGWIKHRIPWDCIPGIFPGNWEQKLLSQILFWAMGFAGPRLSFKTLVVSGW